MQSYEFSIQLCFNIFEMSSMAGYLSMPEFHFGKFKISYIESISRAMSANLTIPIE